MLQRSRRLPAGDLRQKRPACVLQAAVIILFTLLAGPTPPLVVASAAETLATTAAGPDADATIRCDPAPASQFNGNTININLYLENVADLYGADVKLLFDVVNLQVVDASPAEPGIQLLPLAGFLAPDFVLRKIGDNVSGSAWYAVTQLNPHLPVTGSGPIVRVTLQALRAGTFVLPFDNTYKLANRQGMRIPAIALPCTITFWGPINLAISRSGVATNSLTWSYLGSDVHHAEVWRSTTAPYLTPGAPGASQVLPGPLAGDTHFDDPGAGSGANQFYVLRAVKADNVTVSAPSNRVGAFHFTLAAPSH